MNKSCELKNGDVYTIQIWDTAGQESFRSVTRAYYKATAIAMIVYDISNQQSFENIEKWVQDVSENAAKDIELILIGNKSDLEDQRKVPYEEGKKLAEKYNMSFYETSAKNGSNIVDSFYQSLENIRNKIMNNTVNLELCGIKKLSSNSNSNDHDTLYAQQISNQKKKCC